MFQPQNFQIRTADFYSAQFKLILDRYISLVSQFTTSPLMLPFIKVINTQSGQGFAGNPGAAYGFGVPSAIVATTTMESTTKQAATKIDSLFITFHTSDRAKAICVQPYIRDFKITAEDAGNQTYPGGGITMNTYNDHVQLQMLLDALNYSNNALASLPWDYLTSCFLITNNNIFNVNISVLNTNMINRDTTNFLLDIQFATDSSYMEDLARTCNYINWNTYGSVVVAPCVGQGANNLNLLAPTKIVFSAVGDWNMVLNSSVDPYPNQCYSTQLALNF